MECGKKIYSEREANGHINGAHTRSRHKDKRRRSKKIPVRKYYCKECNGWHLSSKSFFRE